MPPTEVPTEIELLYQLKPCAAEHSESVAGKPPLPCAYFRKWGTWHSFDYEPGQPLTQHTVKLKSAYAGRRPLVAEALSGCRKAPVVAVGINPNLPAWWHPNAINPLFDEIQEFAHYFRYRAIEKLRIPEAEFEALGGAMDEPHFSTRELSVAADASGQKTIPIEADPVTMYQGYGSLLADLAQKMGWPGGKLAVGEDLAYGNMVACPSAKWLLSHDSRSPDMPPMTMAEMNGITQECWSKRGYFLRQLAHTLPSVLLVFSQSTANAFIGQMQGNFVKGDPKLGEKVADLLTREVRLGFPGTPHSARVIFSPHITGNPQGFTVYRPKVLAQLVDEAHKGGLAFNAATGHLTRGTGPCTLCPAMGIGPCDYADELVPHDLAAMPGGGPESTPARTQKIAEQTMVSGFLQRNAAARMAIAAQSASLAEAAPANGWELAAQSALNEDDDGE